MFEKLFNSAPDEMQEKYQNKWEKENLLQKSIDIRDGKEPFIFYEGPPTANGKPGIHHVIARTLKDSVCRYKTMKGFKVERKAGGNYPARRWRDGGSWRKIILKILQIY